MRVITIRNTQSALTPFEASWLNYSSSGQRDTKAFMNAEAAKNYCKQRFGACRFVDKTGAAD